MNGQNVACPYNGTLLSHEKEVTTSTWYNTYESCKQIFVSQIRRSQIVEFHLHEMSRIGESAETKSKLAVARIWAKGANRNDY